MNKLIDAITCKSLPARDIKNANIVNLWALIWAGTLILSTYLLEYDWFSTPLPTLSALSIHAGTGLALILAYKRFLKHLDELERKIQLEALALAVGLAIVGFSSYSILEKAAMVPDLKPSYLIVLLALTYCIGITAGRIRYR